MTTIMLKRYKNLNDEILYMSDEEIEYLKNTHELIATYHDKIRGLMKERIDVIDELQRVRNFISKRSEYVKNMCCVCDNEMMVGNKYCSKCGNKLDLIYESELVFNRIHVW